MNVRLISDNSHSARSPDPWKVKCLTELLEAAQAGRLTQFAMVAEYTDDDPQFFVSDLDDPYRMSGLLSELSQNVGED